MVNNYFYISNSFSLIYGDTMQEVPLLTEQFDMIFADPPYFISGGGKTIRGKKVMVANFGDWDKIRPDKEKDEFNYQWLSLCREKLKDNGTIWVSGTFHNIYSVARCMSDLGYKILNVITWQKVDPPPSLTGTRFNFSTEFIIWAAKSEKSKYYLNFDLMTQLNGGKQMSDVWRLPSVGMWEKHCGKHPTQKPLHLLYRIILATTRRGDTILDPFTGSCTTGIAANLLGRNFVGIEQCQEYLDYGIRRRKEIEDSIIAEKIFRKMSETPDEAMVMVNHCRTEIKRFMIEKGICYLRAGDSKGSLLVSSGFERMQYVLLHTGGEDCHLFRLKTKGHFQIWTKETLEEYGFHPEHAPYYVVLHFDKSKEIEIPKQLNLKQRINTYRAKIRPLSDFIGIK
ncbi:MAG: site-specific DNA-methyltransferase [Bacteroidales bacterium]|nr:site-specific DNA-methyltransferase [Bacteroidales bacterium]